MACPDRLAPRVSTVTDQGAGLRLCKIVLLASAALYVTLVAFNNVTDYGSNFQFVAHVLSMDTTFPGNKGMWRALDAGFVHHAAYILIIGTEIVVAALAWFAVVRLWQARADAVAYRHNKRFANYALTLGIVLWFTGFIAVGGEWFLMWQSETWNGIQSAFRIACFLTLLLIFINMDD